MVHPDGYVEAGSRREGRRLLFFGRRDRNEAGRAGETVVHWRNGCYTRVPDDDSPHYFQADGTRAFPRFDDLDPDALYYVEP